MSMGSHWGLNTRPRILPADALTTELRLLCSNPAFPPTLELEQHFWSEIGFEFTAAKLYCLDRIVALDLSLYPFHGISATCEAQFFTLSG